MIEGFKNGIMSRVQAIKDSVMNVVNNIKSLMHFSRPDKRTIKRLREMDA